MKNRLALLALASATLLCRPALAEDPAGRGVQGPGQPTPEQEAEEKAASIEVYVMLMPFVEYVDVVGPTVRGFMEEPGHVGTATADYTGVDGPWRFRMTAGSSHFGVRGALALAPQLKVIGQFENALSLDGDANPWETDFPNRNSYVGLTGDWGTLAAGRLDTPYKWTTSTMVNPIKGGYVADYTAIIGTPGFLGQALNSVPRWTFSPFSNVAFERREANSIQYWSPTLWGLSLRAGWVANEWRPSEETFDDGTLSSPETNPYIASLALGFDWEGLRLRYAWESHHDYYGVAYVAQATAPSTTYLSSNDWGNKATAQYTLTVNDDMSTRLAVIGEHLKYKMSYSRLPPDEFDNVSGQVNRYSRPAFYALLEQTLFDHHVWGAYGRAFAGECSRIPLVDGTPVPCVTEKVGAEWMQLGYMYEFSEDAQAFFMAYRLKNERSGVYVTTPSLPREGLSPGLDQLGAGVGFRYAFGAELLR